jgi:hypothetical protein
MCLVTQSSVSHWLTPAQSKREYFAETTRLRLPSGQRWPKSALGTPEAARYEEGFSAGRADLYWFMAWSSLAISPEASTVTRQSALDQLSRVYATPFYRRDLTDKARFKQMIVRAQRGDLSELRSFVAANRQGGE